MEKRIKGSLILSLSVSIILASCAAPKKAVTPTPVPTKAVIQSLNPNDLNLDGLDTPAAATDPAAAGTTPAATDPAAAAGTTPAVTDPAAAGTTPAVTDPAASGTTPAVTDPAAAAAAAAAASAASTISTTVTPAPGLTPTATPDPAVTTTPTSTSTSTPTPVPTPTITTAPTAVPNLVGNEYIKKIDTGVVQPGGIDIRNGSIYISNYDKASGCFLGVCTNLAEGEIKIFNTAGNLLKTIQGSTGNSLPSYNVPDPLTGIVTDGNKVWVAAKNPYAQAKTNIYSFNVDGAARKDSIYGISSANIKDMAIDPSIKTIYVADGNNLGKFNYGADGAITDQANFFVAGINPSGIAIDDLGNIFAVSNAATANIVPIIKYGKTGIEVLRFTTKGKNQAGPTVSAVGDIAYDPNLGGIIYVLARLTTTGNMAILRFDSQGNFIRYFGEEASMQDPVGIALGSDGSLFVTDNAANGIFQFAPAK